jgi:hypothetical protein
MTSRGNRWAREYQARCTYLFSGLTWFDGSRHAISLAHSLISSLFGIRVRNSFILPHSVGGFERDQSSGTRSWSPASYDYGGYHGPPFKLPLQTEMSKGWIHKRIPDAVLRGAALGRSEYLRYRGFRRTSR